MGDIFKIQGASMGTFGKSIVKGNVDEIVALLNKAYADDWFFFCCFHICIIKFVSANILFFFNTQNHLT